MNISVLTVLFAALKFSSGVRGSPSQEHDSVKTTQQDPLVYLCDCWTDTNIVGFNGPAGSQSVVAIYVSGQPPSGNNTSPDISSVVSTNFNYDFETGGSVYVAKYGDFTWASLVNTGLPGVIAGSGSLGGMSYDIYRINQTALYKISPGNGLPANYGLLCSGFYRAQIKGSEFINGAPTPSTNTSTPTSTSSPTTSSSLTNTGLSLEAKISISIGCSIAFTMFLTLVVLFVRQLRRKRVTYMNGNGSVELDVETIRRELSALSVKGAWSTPSSAVSELHPDTLMEMADRNYRLTYGRPPPYLLPMSPVEMFSDKRYTKGR